LLIYNYETPVLLTSTGPQSTIHDDIKNQRRQVKVMYFLRWRLSLAIVRSVWFGLCVKCGALDPSL